MRKRLLGLTLAAVVASIAVPAQAGPSVGKPVDAFVGCDTFGSCSITLDELGNISGSFVDLFGVASLDVTLTHIASTLNASFVDQFGNALEVTSYLVRGQSHFLGDAPLQLEAGALGLCDVGVTDDGSACTGANGDLKGDVLIFTDLGIDANGFGSTRIDFLSDAGFDFRWATDFNVLEVGPQGNNSAVHNAFGSDNNERMTYNITSDSGQEVPEPATIALVGLALAGLGLSRRKG